jgi:hypothetical protein
MEDSAEDKIKSSGGKFKARDSVAITRAAA